VGDGAADPLWQNAYARASDLVSQMTIDEKVNMTNGHPGDCVGNTPSIERLGIPKLWCVPHREK
jgi:beta-glucosidase